MYDVRFVGNINKESTQPTILKMRKDKEYEEVLSLSDVKMIFNKVAIQTNSTCSLSLEIKYSIWPYTTVINPITKETFPEEEYWEDYKTISVSANSPKIEELDDLPVCKFLKFKVTPSVSEGVEYATLCLLFM